MRIHNLYEDGDALITASDGESRTINAGEIVLVEDVSSRSTDASRRTGNAASF